MHPCRWTLLLPYIKGTAPPWRLNPVLLSDETFCKKIKSIQFFLDTNKTDSVSNLVLWETLKAFIRGEIISYSSYVRKSSQNKLEELANSISSLDSRISLSPTPELIKKRVDFLTGYNLLSTNQAETHAHKDFFMNTERKMVDFWHTS